MPPPPPSTSAGVRRSMQGNRRSGTKPEVALRSALHRRGLRFRKDHRLDLEGARVRPDVVFTRAKVAVFVDGCFWHCCPLHFTAPKSNPWYWGPKLQRNIDRDARAARALGEAGWRVVRVWEHASVAEAVEAVADALPAARCSP